MKVLAYPFRRRPRPAWVAIFTLILCFTWVAIDLSIPIKKNIRVFDPLEVARLDTEMWRSYYDRKPVVLFSQLAELMRTQFHAPFFRSYVMAYQAARAAFVFKDGQNRKEYENALPYLIDFYTGIEQMSIESFEAEKAAALELEWWIIHRQRTRYTIDDLETALAKTASAIYGQPAYLFREHARLRAHAMHIRDTKAVHGGLTNADWSDINTLLNNSWKSFEQVVRK